VRAISSSAGRLFPIFPIPSIDLGIVQNVIRASFLVTQCSDTCIESCATQFSALRTPSFCDAIKGSESYYFCGFIQPLSNVERLPQGCNKPIKNRSFVFAAPRRPVVR